MTTCLSWTVRRRHWDLGQIYSFQQILIVQPSERGQFLIVGVDDDAGPGPVRRQHGSIADRVLLMMVCGMIIVVTIVATGAAVVAVAATAGRNDHVVVVDEVVLHAAHVHLFRGEQDNVSDAVHAVRGGYIILAELSLLQYHQFGRRRRRRRGQGRGWRHDRRRR